MHRCLLGTAVFALVLGQQQAHGQCVSVETDMNMPLANETRTPYAQGVDADCRFSVALGFFSKSYLRSDADHRWGVVLSHRSATSRTAFPRPATRHHPWIGLQFSYDRLVLERSRAALAIGAAVGPMLMNKENAYYFDAVWTVSPYAKCPVSITSRVALVLGVRGDFHAGEQIAFPYESGVVFSVGLEMGGRHAED